MSYRKVGEGGQTFSHSGTMSVSNPSYNSSDLNFDLRTEIESNQENLMTYVRCPNCYSNQLIKSNNIPEHYSCSNCGWNNFPNNYSYQQNTSPMQNNTLNTRSNVNNNSLLARAIRR